MTNSADRGILTATGPEPVRRAAYGPAAHHVYEVFLPDTPPRAWVVLVHGGFWRAEWDRAHLRPLAAGIAGEGYAVALVEYVRPGMSGGGWPATGEDLAAAVAAVVRDEAAGIPVVLVGHSAGGHLAVWVLHRPESEGVRGAVSLAGCLDLRLVHEEDLGDGAALNLMAATPQEQPEAWAEADPARLGRTPYPVAIVHGDRDERVPVAVSRSWWERAGTPDRDRWHVLPDAGHFSLIDPEAPAYTTLRESVEGLLRRT